MSDTLGPTSAPEAFLDGTESGLDALLDNGGRVGLSALSSGLDAMTGAAASQLEERAESATSAIEAAPLETELDLQLLGYDASAASVAGNSDPVANAVWVVAGEEDGDVTFSLNYSDTDAGDTHTVVFDFGTSVSATMAPLTDNGDGTYTFHANDTYGHLTEGQFHYETFNYTVYDNNGGSATNNVTIAFEGENDAPVAASVFAQSAPYVASQIDVSLAFTDADQWDSHTVDFYNLSTGELANEFLIGTNTVGSQIVYSFAPQQDYGFLVAGESITEAYRYVVTDAAGGTSEALMMLTWTGENDSPVASATAVSVSEDAPDATFTLEYDDPDAGDTHTVTFLQAPGAPWVGSSVMDNGDGTFSYWSGGAYDYLSAGETITDIYEYTVTDSFGFSSTNTVTFTITGEDDPVVLNSYYPPIVTQGTTSLLIPNLIMDADVNEIHLVQFEGQSGGFVPWGADYEVDLEPIFGPDPFRNLGQWDIATETISYTVQTSSGDLLQGEVTVDFQGVNDSPDAMDMTVTGNESDGRISFTLEAYDPDQFDYLTFTVDTMSGPTGPIDTGIFTINPDGTVEFDFGDTYDYLTVGQTAVETFSYTVTDSQGMSDTATGTIVINGESEPQGAADIFLSAHEDDDGATTSLPIDIGPGGADSVAFYQVVNGVRGAQVFPTETPSGGGQTLYTIGSQADYEYLTDGQSVTEIYEYVPVSGGVEGDSGQIYVTYDGQNDIPIANDFGITMSEDDTTFVFTPDFTDPDANDTHSVFFMPGTGMLNITDNFDGTFTIDNFFDGYGYLNEGETATETFMFDVSDSSGGFSSAVLTVTVTGADEMFV